ncbi:MAG: transcriptional repressor LexA [Firmicutes bacterium]|jgi:repressor LexA|nr:transcriptional repressor LexA [Candidatus Fermentithermobacillaceae bacterium]
MEELTFQQARVLEVICEYIREKGYPPSVRELGERLGLKSTATVHSHLRTLERKGYLERTAQKSRAFNVVEGIEDDSYPQSVMVPIVGTVRAGVPILAVENIDEFVPLPRSLLNNENVFMLRVQGDSMIGAGIFDGDLVLVKQQESAENGDIVVALLDDEATVKTFYKDEDSITLRPENPDYEPIVSGNVHILGKVVGLYRSFH